MNLRTTWQQVQKITTQLWKVGIPTTYKHTKGQRNLQEGEAVKQTIFESDRRTEEQRYIHRKGSFDGNRSARPTQVNLWAISYQHFSIMYFNMTGVCH